MYRTTGAGGAGQTDPAPVTNMTAAFAGVANPTGTWTLRMEDGCAGDTGSISAATLTVEGGVVVPNEANADFDGDGKTDYSNARDNSPPPAIGTFNNDFFRAESVREKLRIQAEQTDSPSLGVPGGSITWYIQRTQSNSPRVEAFGNIRNRFYRAE